MTQRDHITNILRGMMAQHPRVDFGHYTDLIMDYMPAQIEAEIGTSAIKDEGALEPLEDDSQEEKEWRPPKKKEK